VIGFFMRRHDFPVAPVVLGMIIGPLLEVQFRRALLVSEGNYAIFVTRPLSGSLLALALLVMIAPHLPKLLAVLRGRRPTAQRLVFGQGRED
jgi:putative tricarboxylic transport membrane protein